MEQDLLLLQDQAGGMDTVVVDKWAALKKRGALGAMLKSSWTLDTPCLGPVGLET
jgi:hypothetical protein